MSNRKIIIAATGFIVSLLSFSLGNMAYGQVYGCNDSQANNFNNSATVNDGSCTYNVTTYTPPVKAAALSDSLLESSGLQMAGGYLWSFNDGGGYAAIYRIDTLTNTLLQKVNLSGATNVDWEDIAFDGTYFYIGDFGNNSDGARADLTIYKFPLSAIPDYNTFPVATISAAQIDIIHFYYSDQPQPPVATTSNNTQFDCEAMIVDGGKIHLFTKNWISLSTTHYVINGLTAGSYIATPLETLAVNYLVTGADKAPGKNLVALLGYSNSGFRNHYMHLFTDYNAGKYFNGNKRRIDLPDAFTMGQAEGICFRTITYGYISNEQFTALGIKQKLRSFDIASYVGSLPSPLYNFNGNGNWDDPANWTNHIVPPATLSSGSEIIIDPAIGGQCLLNIPFTVSTGAKLTVNASKKFIVQGNLTQQ